eukprot:8061465-Lingulodinium_polyedra.AAC.1
MPAVPAQATDLRAAGRGPSGGQCASAGTLLAVPKHIEVRELHGSSARDGVQARRQGRVVGAWLPVLGGIRVCV